MEDTYAKTLQGNLVLSDEWREWTVLQKKNFKQNGRTNWAALSLALKNHFGIRPNIDSLYLRNQVNSFVVRI